MPSITLIVLGWEPLLSFAGYSTTLHTKLGVATVDVIYTTLKQGFYLSLKTTPTFKSLLTKANTEAEAFCHPVSNIITREH